MANDATVTFRCSTEELTRADVLAPLLEQDPNIRAFGKVSRSTVLRLALTRGLDVLEAEHNPGTSSKRKASR